MPQIDQMFEIWSSQLFWLLITFGFVFFVIGRGMVPKVMDTVGMRDKQIADDLAAAQAARDAADEAEEAWRQRENANREAAQDLVNKAKAKAQKSTDTKLAKVQAAIDTQLEEAEARIEASRKEAGAEIEAVATEAAQDIAKRLAGVKATKAAAKSAVKEAMSRV
ncbi:F0F1 ATP synthase subunit B family protein [Aurantiacibacter sp. D1-12]|uniref:F0F1 ATP synthase subunit B family protein n=1 Tax=Aurantiacibacter sp. D1-12 TaxID=2993658 RepID=UPI00237D2F5E|nr:ATPase [Aurantiacibacter sp. D1-12]MDE1468371.1 ATPase [Aurantiacibacter sp. D1-12]